MQAGRSPEQTSITVVIPALNEENGLAGAVETVVEAAERWFADYEVLIFNDGSTDRTGEVADALAERFPHVRAFHHETPRCMGGVIRRGWQEARMQYVTWVDGQGATTAEALADIFAACGGTDLVIPFAANQHERPLARRVIARAFRTTLNVLFGLSLRQYTHLVVYPTAIAKRLRVHTDSYAFQAEAVVKAVRSGADYVEIGVEDNFQIEGRRSKAFRMKNVLGVATFLVRTLWDVYIGHGYLSAAEPVGSASTVESGRP